VIAPFLLLPLVVAAILLVGAGLRALVAEVNRLANEVRQLSDLRPALVELRDSSTIARQRMRRARRA